MDSPYLLNKFESWKIKMMEDHGVTEEHLLLVLDSQFDYIAWCVDNPTMPQITIPGFGTLKPSKGLIKRSLRMVVKWRKIKGESYRERAVEMFSKLWPIKNRLLNEKNEEYTAKNWYRHFLESVGAKNIVYKEGRKRWWMQDFPGYTTYKHNPNPRPNYSLRIEKNKKKQN